MKLNRAEWSSSPFDRGIINERGYCLDRFGGAATCQIKDMFGIYADGSSIRYIFKYLYSAHPFYVVRGLGEDK